MFDFNSKENALDSFGSDVFFRFLVGHGKFWSSWF
ncbi:hypothetical protein CLV62_14413 [Dysgonomonas alginatilytica]|uniref:Uncharacterized protein n=1 Tax=Dysgonomonas alginatilytica TaxID=1605892 RepID=A0A2V3PHR4_9BACT|nr:hypothetical protein CLV62_14413 [Dysgonomonas alginatilytica]